jgi:hypothetical protein
MVFAICVQSAPVFGFSVALDVDWDGNLPISFDMQDETGGAFADDIQVTLTNRGTVYQYRFVLSPANAYSAPQGVLIVEGGHYLVQIDYPSRDTYGVTWADGKAIDTFTANPNIDGGFLFEWKVAEIGAEAIADGGSVTRTTVAEPESRDFSCGNPEGDALLYAFLDAIEYARDDPEWMGYLWLSATGPYPEDLFPGDEYYKRVREDRDVDIGLKQFMECFNGSREEWIVKSRYERMIWYHINSVIPYYSSVELYRSFFESEKTFLNGYHAGSTIYTLRDDLKDPDAAEAYKNLLAWLYHQFVDEGKIYTFTTGERETEVTGVDVAELQRQERERERQEAREMSEAYSELQSGMTAQERRDVAAFGAATPQKTSPALFVIAIVVVLVAGIIVTVVIIRRGRRDD